MTIKEVKEGDSGLARYIPAREAGRDGLNFFSPDEDYVQVGSWCYEKGKQLSAHQHNRVERMVPWTQEVLYIRQGRVRVKIYNSQSELVDQWDAVSGDIVILLRGGHGYEILENDTQILEVKNGPYVGAEKDRRRL